MKTKLFTFLLCLFTAYACSVEQVENPKNAETPLKQNIYENLYLDKESSDVNSLDAKKVAMLFQLKNDENIKSSRSVTDINLDDMSVETIYDEENNTPLFYIVNKGNNNGFVIVSATKKAHPIIAFSESGTFNVEHNIGSETFVGNYKEQIKEAISSDENFHQKEWALFEKEYNHGGSRASSAEIEAMIQAEINSKTALGYTYIGKLTALPYYLPQNECDAVIRDIASNTNPAYDYEDVSLFFIKTYDFQKVNELTSTKWHQGYPFNIGTPNGYAGCVPIAVAQIAYYHKYPNSYNWSQIYANPVLNASFDSFIRDVRRFCTVTYNDDSTSSTYDYAYDAFRSLGYTVTKQTSPGAEYLRNEITASRPVFMRGENTSTDKGHAWICEGYLNKKYQAVISMIDARGDGTPYFDYPLSVNPVNDDQYGEFFYMNFGWGGQNDGWYRSNAYNPHAPNYSFTYNQKLLLVRKP